MGKYSKSADWPVLSEIQKISREFTGRQAKRFRLALNLNSKSASRFLTRSISLVSLASFAIYFLFPHMALANSVARNRILEFDLSETIKVPIAVAKTENGSATANINTEEIQHKTDAVIFPQTEESADAAVNTPAEAPSNGREMKVAAKKWVYVTAYSSTPDQTDSTPFVTASNTRVRDGIVAANFLRFGAKIRIPSIHPDKIFVVEDRMRSNKKVDIWFPTRREALNFGIRWTEIEILSEI